MEPDMFFERASGILKEKTIFILSLITRVSQTKTILLFL